MRSIGRRLREASPTSVLENGCAASNPASMRIVEPELPQSRAVSGCRKFTRAAANRNRAILAAFDLRTQLLHAGQRAVRVRAAGKVRQVRRAFSETRQHGIAVRDALVPRQP